MLNLDPYLDQKTSCLASVIVASSMYRSDDWPDLKQDLILDCLRRSPKFDPERGDRHGFIRGVVGNCACALIIRQRRRAPEVLCADLINREVATDAGWLDKVDKRPRANLADALHLRLDVGRVLDSLPKELRSLALLLSQMPVQEVCRLTGRSRSRVYQMTVKIRNAFLRAGFSPRMRSALRNRCCL